MLSYILESQTWTSGFNHVENVPKAIRQEQHSFTWSHTNLNKTMFESWLTKTKLKSKKKKKKETEQKHD